MEIVYYGETICQATIKSTGNRCSNLAYYTHNHQYLCGVHCKKNRVNLPVNPHKQENVAKMLKEHEQSILDFAKENVTLGKRGQLKCAKMKMMKPVQLIQGYLNVFPNNKHENRKDGFGCCALSPMRLGPIIHYQPNLPVAKNIENFHQSQKTWPNEVDEDGNPTEEWRTRRLQLYNDDVPHRHKFDQKKMAQLRKEIKGANRNAPLYSIHETVDGKEKRFTYVESRYFYCCMYEKLAKQTAEFKKLQSYLDKGINLIICGYDAYDVTHNMYTHYCDPTKAFGHELVLYTLLTTDEYPWRLYREQHKNIYKGISDKY